MGPVASQGGAEDAVVDESTELEARLLRYPVARYPAQHATTAFHLATVHLQRSRVTEAMGLLVAAYDIFARLGMRLEQAKALMMHGVALREAGRSDLAALTFDRAAKAFGALDQPVEEAAASYDLGLSWQQQGHSAAAQRALARAYDLFLEAGYLAQAGAAARERGLYLLTGGELGPALPLLQEAAEMAERSGDRSGFGTAANALGLLYLAAEDAAAAVTAFTRAVGAFPRSLRGPDHAMVKANLAVAYERVGNPARARLAARQALAVAGADPAVRSQAQLLLDRLSGATSADLLAVLDDESPERWSVILRDEVLRWSEARPPEQLAAIGGFVAGLLARPGAGYDLAESLIAVLVELPPDPYAELVATLVQVTGHLGEQDAERFRAVLGSAMARFAIPQWQRLASSLNAAAAAAGQPGGWQ